MSTDIEAGESGIEGILNRLKKERNSSYGLEFREKEDTVSSENNEDKDHRTTMEAVNALIGSSFKIREFYDEPLNGETGLGSLDRNANLNDIKSCILHLESDLSYLLHLLRSTSNKVTSKTENEIINAQDRLHQIIAKLGVLEGKMELAIMDAQKIIEEKQKMINDAQRALQLLKLWFGLILLQKFF
ncbi:hypothetical protein Lalb_Chr04g0256401 [Lupinus albus]|uniref:Uncharacterized protein n=1 Tax=Lupinus albus TaxID=3870 RepID=A0A6A4QPS7_LUPAL|nr:hypothetical protein Lalb_Chr04g0256401 [Lupinus albus]